MNIFYLDRDPVTAAQYQCDKHVVKMVLETAQVLCSAFDPGSAPYKRTHYNHPSSVWSRANASHYNWTIEHGFALADEYQKRYGKVHKSRAVIQWCSDHKGTLELNRESPFTDPPKCMPDDCKALEDSVQAYRMYYLVHKRDMAAWNHSPEPIWFSESISNNDQRIKKVDENQVASARVRATIL